MTRPCQTVSPTKLPIVLLASIVSLVATGWSAAARADQLLFTNYFNGTVDVIDPSTGNDTGSVVQSLSGPSGLAVAADGSLYISEESSPGDVQHYSAGGAYLGTLPNYADPNNAAYIVSAGNVRIGPDGNVYASDFGSSYNPTGYSIYEFSGADGSYLGSPITGLTSGSGIAFDYKGNIYEADFGSAYGTPTTGKVVEYNVTTGTQSTFVQTSSAPQNAPLTNPDGLLFLPNGNLLVSDLGAGDVLEYNADGTFNKIFASYQTSEFGPYSPGGMTLTPNGQDILVADLGYSDPPQTSGAILEYDLNGNLVNYFYIGASGAASDVAVVPTNVAAWSSLASSDTYGNATAWGGTVPNTAGATASFGAGTTATGSIIVTIDGSYTVGTLSFDNPNASYTLESALTGSPSITLNNNGLGTSVNLAAGGQTATIDTTLILADVGLLGASGGTAFNVGTGSTLTIGAAGVITGDGQPVALTGGGTLVLSGTASYTGGTTIENGTLQVTSTGTIGGPLAFSVGDGNSGVANFASSQTFSSLTSATYTNPNATIQASATINAASGVSLEFTGGASTPALSVAGALNVNAAAGSTGTLTFDGPPTFADASQLNIGAGKVQINAETSTWTVGVGVTINVATVATLQLAASQQSGAASSVSANLVNINNHGSAASGGGLYVAGNQSVGMISGTGSPDVNGATVYDGDTVVGAPDTPATLSATQILQNSLIVNADSIVTIEPTASVSVSVSPAVTAGSGETAAALASSADGDAAGLVDGVNPLSAIQAAIESGAISSALGQHLENRLAAIERLSAVEPSLDAAALENSILASLSSAGLSTSISQSIEWPGETVTIEAVPISSEPNVGDSSSGSYALESGIGISGGATAVPEPASFLLALFAAATTAGLGLRRRGSKTA